MATSDLERAARGSKMTEATCKDSLQVRHTHELTPPAAAMREVLNGYWVTGPEFDQFEVNPHSTRGLIALFTGTRAECQAWIDGRAAEAAICAHEAQRWQPIETAPRDGNWIVVCRGSQQGVARWAGIGWSLGALARFVNPTYWMPLPAPPAGEEG